MAAQDDRECFEILDCPSCHHADVDFVLLDYRRVRCSFCETVVQVTGYKVFLGPPEDPTDFVTYVGVAA